MTTASTLKPIGKKGREWQKNRVQLIKFFLLAGRIHILNGEICGRCEICQEWKVLDPDHIRKRSQGGSDEPENIQWVCRECHDKLDNMAGSEKQKNKKADWQGNHKCFQCKKWTRFLLCDKCGRMSVKR